MSMTLSHLAAAAAKPVRTVIGLMSGTSADAIDVAVCRMSGPGPQVGLLAYDEHPHDPAVQRLLRRPGELTVRDVAELNVLVAEGFAAACLAVLSRSGIDRGDVDLIGSHGQTVYHHSGIPGALRATLQVGDGDVIAVRTGLPVVNDFRAKDVASGGEGAPLSPVGDAVLFGTPGAPRRAVLNLGGIANLTVLDADPARVFGFDTGPANGPLDRLARRLTGGTESCDRDGRLARSGSVDVPTLEALLAADTFHRRTPPKSTGFEAYGDAFVDEAARLHGGHDADLMATLTEFVARTVAEGLRDFVRLSPPVAEVVVAGGGASNPALMERLAAHLAPVALRPSAELGVPGDAREAMIFAVLADMALRGVPAHLPPVTGADAPRVLGKFCLP